jgi:hypothetical protein
MMALPTECDFFDDDCASAVCGMYGCDEGASDAGDEVALSATSDDIINEVSFMLEDVGESWASFDEATSSLMSSQARMQIPYQCTDERWDLLWAAGTTVVLAATALGVAYYMGPTAYTKAWKIMGGAIVAAGATEGFYLAYRNCLIEYGGH